MLPHRLKPQGGTISRAVYIEEVISTLKCGNIYSDDDVGYCNNKMICNYWSQMHNILLAAGTHVHTPTSYPS